MFVLKKIINSFMNSPEPEFLEVQAGETIACGQTLVIVGGKLKKASGTTKPTHIALSKTSGVENVEDFPVFRITPNMLFRTKVTFSTTPIPLVVGSKVTIDAAGEGVTDVTASGVVTVKEIAGAKATGDVIFVAFEN